MAKFLFIYRDPAAAMAQAPSPEEMQAALEKWGEWIGKFSATGNILDPGDGLKPTGKFIRPGGVVTDGPFVESKEILGGYSVVEANNYDHAATIAMECPALLFGGSLEIRELAGFA